ncbi:MAG: AAA family ATPase [Christensenellales bacterium]|jgi:predicted ABC-type ATPase
MIDCPNCGSITAKEITIYNDSLRKQSFSFSPVLPSCVHCGAQVSIAHRCDGGRIIVLTGTCGSGKSTIAQLLAAMGFLAIDGDCVIQSVKHKRKLKQVDFSMMADEIACEIDILSLLGGSFVLSSVIMPENLDRYIEIFEARNMNYKLFLLKPDYRAAVERCRLRTCHTSITPERWIKHFYDSLNFDSRVIVIDNTDMTAEETAKDILRLAAY